MAVEEIESGINNNDKNKVMEAIRGFNFKKAFLGIAMLLNVIGGFAKESPKGDHPGNPAKKISVEKGEKGEGETKVLSREDFRKEEEQKGLYKTHKDVKDIEQNLDKGERVVGFEEKDGRVMLLVEGFEDQVEKGGEAVPFDKVNEAKTGVSELPLIDRNDMGAIALMENSDGKYALQVEVKGNTIIYRFNNNNKISNEDIKKILDLRNYKQEALKKIADQVHIKIIDGDGNIVGQTTFNLLH